MKKKSPRQSWNGNGRTKNPLWKRLPRELRSELGKYLVIFLFMVATIGFISGFLVADSSTLTAYKESFEKYNIEDGHFVLETQITREQEEEIEKEVILYENFHKDETVGQYTFRIFKNRTEINKVCVMEGSLADKADEIAIDRLFAENNDIEIGDTVELDGKSFTVCGTIAMSDYSALFRSNTDMMFDAQNFTIAAVTEEAFNKISDIHLSYEYAWKYKEQGLTEVEKQKEAEKLKELLIQSTALSDFVQEADNQAIHFTGDDMGSDRNMMIVLLYIVIIIMAFVFAITTAGTIEKEAGVIGTLRASGYTKAELIRHYLMLPVVVTATGAVIGNILGYTLFKNIVAGMYYGSYSLPTYTTIWNAYAFVMTTVIPIVLMLVINLCLLKKKLSLSPLKFLRRDLKKRKNKKAVRLTRGGFIHRFRLRIVLQNIPNYVILFVGILFANLLLLFGMMLSPMLYHYKDEVIENMVSDYQYVLKVPAETENSEAEKYAVTTLNTDIGEREKQDEITVYGIQASSSYFNLPLDNMAGGIMVSNGIMEKFGYDVGDILKLKTKYGEETYSFEIKGSYIYPSALAVFMNIDTFREAFETGDTWFNGYFSDNELPDIEEIYVATVIKQSDMTIVADQLLDSMGSIAPLLWFFAMLLYVLLVWLLSKLIIEKNTVPISIIKILGYRDSEVMKLYIISNAITVVVATLISIPLVSLILGAVWRFVIEDYSGWLAYYVKPTIYPMMFFMGMAAYAVTGALQYRKIKRIPKEEALKNVE